MFPLVVSVLHLLSTSAMAQDSIDAHGFIPAANDGEILDPLVTWRAEELKPGSVAVSGLFEYADRPLVLYVPEQDDVMLLDNVFALNLNGHFGITNRVGVGINAPVYFTSAGPDGADGLGFGDIRLSVPVALLFPKDGGTGAALSVIPFADLPSGNGDRFLGNDGIAGGGILAGRYGLTKLDLDANVGFQAFPTIDYQNLQGGSKLLLSAAAGYAIVDTLGVRLEAHYKSNLKKNEFGGTESPGEILLSLRGRYDSGLNWTLGGATGMTPGAGAAAYRVFAGVGWTFGKPKDTDGDGIIDRNDACIDQPETFNEYKDTDGCPDALSDVSLKVIDGFGDPVVGAKVMVNGKEMMTDAQGYVRIASVMPGSRIEAMVEAPKFQPGVFESFEVPEGATEKQVQLIALPGKVTYKVHAGDGKPIDAKIVFKSKEPIPEPLQLGADGVETATVVAQKYTTFAEAEGWLSERRDIEAKSGEETVVDITMKPAKAKIVKGEIAILEQVQFDFNKATIKPESFALLDQVAQILIDNSQVTKIEVQGHTDDKGSDSYNLKLSQSRVESVVKYLVGKGVDVSRMVAKGYGETKPAVPNTNDTNRAINRRVQFVILEQAAGTTEVQDSGGKSRPQ